MNTLVLLQKYIYVLFFFFCLGGPLTWQEPLLAEDFAIEQLPAGKDVTLPHSSPTTIPIQQRITLRSTDMPQSIKLTSFSKTNQLIPELKVSIQDPKQKKLRTVELKPGSNVIYQFHRLGPISLVLENKVNGRSDLRVRIESDKPLEITH